MRLEESRRGERNGTAEPSNYSIACQKQIKLFPHFSPSTNLIERTHEPEIKCNNLLITHSFRLFVFFFFCFLSSR